MYGLKKTKSTKIKPGMFK